MIKAVSSGGSWGKFSNEFFYEEFFDVVLLLSELNHSQKNSLVNFLSFPRPETKKIINLM